MMNFFRGWKSVGARELHSEAVLPARQGNVGYPSLHATVVALLPAG
jgi:hypothetical protein